LSSHYLAWNDDGVRDRNDYVRDVYGENYCGTGRFRFVEKSEGVESEEAESEEAEPELELFSEESYSSLNENVVRSPPPDMSVMCDPPQNESFTRDLPPHENVVRSPLSDRNVVCSPPPNGNVVCNPLKGQQEGNKFLQKVARLKAQQRRVRTTSPRRKKARIMKRKCDCHRPGQSSIGDRNLRDNPSHKNRAGFRHRRSKLLKKCARWRQHRGRRRRARSRSRSLSPSLKSGRENSGHASSPMGIERVGAIAREGVLRRTIVFDRGKVTG